ncbi:MAG: DUF4440 domain-containing protein [Ignavibacteria bacterium]|nr:DUF4440 domain-containing protein [Ignavibacteria bacterium]
MKYLMISFIVITMNIYSQSDIEKGKEGLKAVDRKFSDLSQKKGMVEAFLAYADENAVILRDYTMPIVGRDAVKAFISEGSNDFTLIWEPLFADISTSLDLGYTYGTYVLTYMDKDNNEQQAKGTYLTIWKKDSSGSWKWVLDNGNQGLEPKK